MRSVKLWRDVDTLEEYQFTNAQFAEFLQQNIQLIRDGYRLYDWTLWAFPCQSGAKWAQVFCNTKSALESWL